MRLPHFDQSYGVDRYVRLALVLVLMLALVLVLMLALVLVQVHPSYEQMTIWNYPRYFHPLEMVSGVRVG